jgi:hypothetical protein
VAVAVPDLPNAFRRSRRTRTLAIPSSVARSVVALCGEVLPESMPTCAARFVWPGCLVELRDRVRIPSPAGAARSPTRERAKSAECCGKSCLGGNQFREKLRRDEAARREEIGKRREMKMSGTGASPSSNYRARRRSQINELLDDLANLNLDPALKEALRVRLILLLRDVEHSHSGDRLLVSKIRDARVQIVALAKS